MVSESRHNGSLTCLPLCVGGSKKDGAFSWFSLVESVLWVCFDILGCWEKWLFRDYSHGSSVQRKGIKLTLVYVRNGCCWNDFYIWRLVVITVNICNYQFSNLPLSGASLIMWFHYAYAILHYLQRHCHFGLSVCHVRPHSSWQICYHDISAALNLRALS